MNDKTTLTIGLFGTCGGSHWREPFITTYEGLGIPYFNPQVDDWKPELADIEADHLANDPIILFPVTDETYGSGSLAEAGFSILQVLRGGVENRHLLIMIAPEPNARLREANETAWNESRRARRLVLAHLEKIVDPKVHVTSNLTDMLSMSVDLHPSMTMMKTP